MATYWSDMCWKRTYKHKLHQPWWSELEERYCEIAAKRLAQDTLFGGVA